VNLDDLMSEAVGPQPSLQEKPWSDRQRNIFGAVQEANTNILINAVAGSGKTTTIVKAMEYAPGSSLFLAFNRAIADELRKRLLVGEARTLNSLGWNLWRQHRPSARMPDVRKEGSKTRKWLDGLFGREHPLVKEYAYSMERLIGLAKNNGWGIPGGNRPTDPDWADFRNLSDSYQLDIPAEQAQDVCSMCARAYWQIINDDTVFDFDDQLFGPVYWNWTFPHFDNVFVDEEQDLNEIQHLMLERMYDSRARIVAVGDPFQSIYGFRGALSDATARIKNRFGMLELPLDVTYRCAQDIVTDAQVFNPAIMARPGAPKGASVWLNSDPEFFPADQLVVCRNNAPLFKAVLRHVRARRPVRCLSNFLETIQSFVKSFRVSTSDQLQTKLDLWRAKEIAAAEESGFIGKVVGIQDKYETLSLFCNLYRTVPEILDCLRQISNGTSGPLFATIHKSKGLEAESVHILRPDLMPAPYARSEAALQQEANLQYVAITRAKNLLNYGEQP